MLKRQRQDERLSSAIRPVIEDLEGRRLMAAVPLPFVLDFGSQSGGLVDKNGEGTGFARVQENKLGTAYQPSLIDLNTIAGQLLITSSGSGSAGTNRDFDNTLTNALEVEFNGGTGAYTVTTRLVGPLSFIDHAHEQGWIMFGANQDNYIKLVSMASTSGAFLQFGDEQTSDGIVTHAVTINKNIGGFALVNTLDLRLTGDPAS